MPNELIREGQPAPPSPATAPAVNGAPAPAAKAGKTASERLLSLDAYRGLIMVTLAFNGFGLAATATRHIQAEGDSPLWKAVHFHADHVQWAGCGYWDLIQPSFMFMVGVAMAYSYLKRSREGQPYGRMLGHAAFRSLVLIALGIFLISNGHRIDGGPLTTNWSFMNVLTQIGLGYTFLFLLWGRPASVQAGVAFGILAATWLLYVLYPYSGIDLATGAPEVGVTAKWAQDNLAGISPAWHKNANVGHAIDVVILNWLPQSEPFVFNRGGYQTINFLPSLATMIFGLMAGELLRSPLSPGRKLLILTGAGVAGIVAGELLGVTGVCPLVKRIWTPSWAIYSTGWCCLILAGLYAVIDVVRFRRWALPLVVVGVNSIAIYCMSMLLKRWAAATWQTHFGADIFTRMPEYLSAAWFWLTDWAAFERLRDDGTLGYWGHLWAPTWEAVLVGVLFWLACLWMYRQKIFVRI